MSLLPPTETADAITVTVSYLQLNPSEPRILPGADDKLTLERVLRPDVRFYRFLYNTVGEQWVWWRRRVMSDVAVEAVLRSPDTHVHVFYRGGQPYGFFELDLRTKPDIDLAYFGLLPFALGCGLGREALRLALDAAWALGARSITVNTCTADHPYALDTYYKAGFKLLRTEKDEWSIPRSLGFVIPERLRKQSL